MTNKEIFDFLVTNGMTKEGACGLMGNLYAESGLRSNNLQNCGEVKLGIPDSLYTNAVDNGSYDNFIRDSFGYGLAQWTYWSRKQNLLNFAKSKGVSIGDCKMQLEFLIVEIRCYKEVWNVLSTTKSVREASDIVLHVYERPADQSEAVELKRFNFSMKYYNQFGNSDEVVKEDTSNNNTSQNVTVTEVPACVTEMARLVIQGRYGNGEARKNNIYNEVQREVDRILKAGAK